jgi:ribosomal protein S26|tara:strand:+ start:3254 stop:3433 length:180 start_codon:yes stop_codon:yes gene_type:complete
MKIDAHEIHYVYCIDCEIDYRVIEIEPSQNVKEVEPFICPFCGNKKTEFYYIDLDDEDR